MSDQDRDEAAGPLVRIGELSRRTGVRADTLRAWERRYGLLEPLRTEGGFRMYSRDDEARIRTMRELIGSGVSAGEAARLARSGPPPEQPAPRASLDGAGRRLREALERFDEAGANAVLDEAIASLSTDALASGVVLPALQEVGDRWRQGEATIGQEHFATNVVRGRLAGLARNWGSGSGPMVILACPPGELHDVGLMVFGLALRARGWRIAFLGANTPIETIAEAAERLAPRAAVIAALTAEPLRAAESEIAGLAGRLPVLLAGAGADRAVADATGTELLPDHPVGAAERLAEHRV